MMSRGRRRYFYNLLIGLWHFWRDFACPLHSECTLTLLVNQFRGSWIPFQVGWWRGHLDISWDINEGFLFSGWRYYIQIIIYLPILSFLLLHFPHTLIWWRTCWSDSCALLRMVDSKTLNYYVWICNIISIFSVILNLINTCMKVSHSPCSWITSFHGFGFNIKVALYQICTRTFILVLWGWGRNIWCMDL